MNNIRYIIESAFDDFKDYDFGCDIDDFNPGDLIPENKINEPESKFHYKLTMELILNMFGVCENDADVPVTINLYEIYYYLYNYLANCGLFKSIDDSKPAFYIDSPIYKPDGNKKMGIPVDFPLSDEYDISEFRNNASRLNNDYDHFEIDIYFDSLYNFKYNVFRTKVINFIRKLQTIFHPLYSRSMVSLKLIDLNQVNNTHTGYIFDISNPQCVITDRDLSWFYISLNNIPKSYGNQYDFNGTGNKEYSDTDHKSFAYKNVLRKYANKFANRVISTGVPMAKEKYGYDLKVYTQYLDVRGYVHNKNRCGFILIDVNALNKKVSQHEYEKCIIDCVFRYIPPVVLSIRSIFIIVRTPLVFTDKVTSNSNRVEYFKHDVMHCDIENKGSSPNYMWRLREIRFNDYNICSRATEHYIVTLDKAAKKKDSMDVRFSDLDDSIMNMVRDGDIFKLTQEEFNDVIRINLEKHQS